MRKLVFAVSFLLLCQLPTRAQSPQEEFLAAVRRGDLANVKALLDRGVSVNARFRYGTTALFPACDRGHAEIVKLLLERGADVNVKDSFYGATPLDWAASKGHAEVVRLLLDKGAQGIDSALTSAVDGSHVETVKAVLAQGGVSVQGLSSALAAATRAQGTEIVKLLEEAGAKPPPKADFQVDVETLASYAGTYRSESGRELAFLLRDGKLVWSPAGDDPLPMNAFNKTSFRIEGFDAISISFRVEGDKVTGLVMNRGGTETAFTRVTDKK